MLLKDIKFPVFSIGSHKKLWYENNNLYLLSESDIIYKVDNKNHPYDSLSKRRARIPRNQRYNFIGTYFTFAQLVKSNKKDFIDSTGRVFRYKKDRRVNLIYRKIIKAQAVENEGFVLYLKGISCPFVVSALVYNYEKYAGVLSINNGYLLYELSEDKKSDTWRKI